MDDALTHRARYHPLADVETLVANTSNGRRTRVVVRRCAMHAALWDNLSEPQQSAAEHVSACHAAVHGSQAPAVDLSRLIEPRGNSMPAELEQYRRADYFGWQNECLMDGIDFRPAVIICGEGGSISAITRNRTKGAKMTADLKAALDVMARLKGWK